MSLRLRPVVSDLLWAVPNTNIKQRARTDAVHGSGALWNCSSGRVQELASSTHTTSVSILPLHRTPFVSTVSLSSNQNTNSRIDIANIYLKLHKAGIIKHFRGYMDEEAQWVLSNALRREDGQLFVIDFARAAHGHRCYTHAWVVDCRQRFLPALRCEELGALFKATEVFEKGKYLHR